MSTAVYTRVPTILYPLWCVHTALFIYSLGTRSLRQLGLYIKVRCWHGCVVHSPTLTGWRMAGSPSRRTPVTPCVPKPPRRCCAQPRLCQARGSPARVRAQGSSAVARAPPTCAHSCVTQHGRPALICKTDVYKTVRDFEVPGVQAPDNLVNLVDSLRIDETTPKCSNAPLR
jgi:hypothetical protein